MARSGYDWKPERPFWTRMGDYWIADREVLARAIAEHSDDHIRRRMGNGYHLLGQALDGVRLSKYEVSMVEWGIAAPLEGNPSCWAPPKASAGSS